MSLAKQLATLANPAPASFDPDVEDSEDLTRARLVEHDEFEVDNSEQYTSGHIRKSVGTNLANDERYQGKVTRRQQISSDVEEELSEDDDDEISIDNEESYSDNGDHSEDPDETLEKSTLQPQIESTLKTFSHVDLEDEYSKAQAVQAQLKLWERLLATRIRLQRITCLINQLPQTKQAWLDDQSENCKVTLQSCRKSMKLMLDQTSQFQNIILQSNPATKNLIEGNEAENIMIDDDEEILSSPDEDEEEKEIVKKPEKVLKTLKLAEYPQMLAKRHESFVKYRNKILLHWYEKTKLASGKTGGKNDFSSLEKNVVQQINQVLSDQRRLLKRTQMKRSDYEILGKNPPKNELNQGKMEEEENEENYDEEIFDDDDFYHQLLREVIERKTAGVTDPHALGRQWLEVQKLRNKVKKKLVDRKASKARKIRYDVMPKLVNFIAPVDSSIGVLYDTRQELFKSLFNKAIV